MPALSERLPLLDADQTSLALQLWQAAAAGDMKGVKERVDIAKYLLAEGADINAKFEPHGDSSFELAERSTSKGGQEVYQLLKVVYEKQLEKKRAELQKAQAAK